MTDSIDMIATDRALKARHRTMWALGDYPAVATDMIAELGPVLVAASGVRRGQRVLDVAAGSGNAAVPAALTGAEVVPPSSHPSCSPQAARSPRGRVASWSGPRETCSAERGLLN